MGNTYRSAAGRCAPARNQLLESDTHQRRHIWIQLRVNGINGHPRHVAVAQSQPEYYSSQPLTYTYVSKPQPDANR